MKLPIWTDKNIFLTENAFENIYKMSDCVHDWFNFKYHVCVHVMWRHKNDNYAESHHDITSTIWTTSDQLKRNRNHLST